MQHYIIFIIVPVVLILLIKLASREEPRKIGKNGVLLEYGRTIKVFGMSLSIFFLVFIAVMGIKDPPDDGEMGLFYTVLGIPLTTLTYFYLEFFRVRILLTDETITASTPWRGTRYYKWEEIQEVSYSPVFRWLKIKFYNKKTLYVSEFITGFGEFIRKMMDKVPIPKYQKALDRMDGHG